MHEINAVVLDKTGTITLGQPVVHDITWGKNSDTSKNKLILLGIEKKSDHPLAEPVVKYLLDEGNSDNIEITSVENIPGRGIKAAADGETFYIGNRKLMEENNIALNEELNRVAGIGRDDARSLSFFSDSKKVISVISISDTIKDTSREAIKELHDLGIEVHMLTGDNEQSAALIAAEAGIDKYRSEMLPGAKHDYIKELQERGKIVAMAGDGINDSQALARADVSIAMGKGSDIAIDTAKMTILSSDLTRIPVAVRLSRQTVTAIRQNLFWAFLYNIIAIPVAAGILYPFTGFLMNPMTGGAAMAMSSLSVLANSLRLRRMKLS
jgi:Cu2+-exporting ATPase